MLTKLKQVDHAPHTSHISTLSVVPEIVVNSPSIPASPTEEFYPLGAEMDPSTANSRG